MGLKVHEAAYRGDVKRLKATVNAGNVNTINDKVHLFAASESVAHYVYRKIISVLGACVRCYAYGSPQPASCERSHMSAV